MKSSLDIPGRHPGRDTPPRTGGRWLRSGILVSGLLHVFLIAIPIRTAAPSIATTIEIVEVEFDTSPHPQPAIPELPAPPENRRTAKPTRSLSSSPAPRRPLPKRPSDIPAPALADSPPPLPAFDPPRESEWERVLPPPPVPLPVALPTPMPTRLPDSEDAEETPPAPGTVSIVATRSSVASPAPPLASDGNPQGEPGPVVGEALLGGPAEPHRPATPQGNEPHGLAVSMGFEAAVGSSPPATHDTPLGAASGPRFLRREQPVYPRVARRLGIEGTVLLRLTIDEYGRLTRVEVVEGADSDNGFAEAAVAAVRRSLFAPAERDGKTVASRAILPVRFTLRRTE